jgi:hypothetical protein
VQTGSKRTIAYWITPQIDLQAIIRSTKRTVGASIQDLGSPDKGRLSSTLAALSA